MSASRERLRTTFDSAAALYHQARPDYPEELFDALVTMAALVPGAMLAEIGCASGKATLPLARRGFGITCVELGAALAGEARRNLAGFERVTVINADFESWRPPAPAAFDLVYAATAWHWIDPGVGYAKARELLRPGGHLAFWGATHVVPADGDPFFREIQDIYDEIGEGMPGGWEYSTAETLPDDAAEIEGSGLFADVRVRRFGWEVSYTAPEYLRLLDTFSGHIAMAPWQRDRLYGEIRRRLALRPAGTLRRHWGAVLHVARRRLALTACRLSGSAGLPSSAASSPPTPWERSSHSAAATNSAAASLCGAATVTCSAPSGFRASRSRRSGSVPGGCSGALSAGT